MHADEFIAPSKKYADIIIPHWPNEAAVDLITQHVRSKVGMQDLRRVYSNLKIMPHNAQCRQLHTIVRDRTTSLTDFVFYADRLFRLVIEYGLGHLPFRDDMVETPLGCEYSGSKGPETFDRICAVSLVRAGEAMESALMQVCKNVRIGKVLLRFSKTKSEWQTSEGFEKPSVIYCKLPPDIRDRYVLVLDPCVGRGWAGQEVVRLLKEKGVCERNICMVTIIAAPEGITRLCGTFPEMKFVTTEIDAGVNEKGFIIPGIGNFADRYFGTEDTENVFFAATPAQTETEGRGSQFALRLSVGSSSGGRTNSPTASRSPTRSLRAEAVPAPQRDPEPFFLDPLPEQQEREGEGE
uniref:uracil phosphoribosyltransferase n=1 Tax=Chromera velia CCMP2878 TaxID=1169474 RepID=A0A0G4IB17_9ALVE|eukprot:Cvel_12700.t1-p1 / transcript=Cvel_12700.t1 / gene=Cvel_12700 / organism=Chromera_velia_CCMP2878 / gene_product=Uridine kinase-like protein 4, putative / transcript_product=Uridine kinase-like protein 4, putative / location=Cvel_scaffold841:59383-64795(-) / protein_length=351 / sequence_SO=supercontig / SO=protein_coding / is_pseudo=false